MFDWLPGASCDPQMTQGDLQIAQLLLLLLIWSIGHFLPHRQTSSHTLPWWLWGYVNDADEGNGDNLYGKHDKQLVLLLIWSRACWTLPTQSLHIIHSLRKGSEKTFLGLTLKQRTPQYPSRGFETSIKFTFLGLKTFFLTPSLRWFMNWLWGWFFKWQSEV